MIALDLWDLVRLAFIALGLTGVWLQLQIPRPYDEIGAGELSLDVPDNVPPAALDSPAGQEELRQLADAVARLQETRRSTPPPTQAGGRRTPPLRPGPRRGRRQLAGPLRRPRLSHPGREP